MSKNEAPLQALQSFLPPDSFDEVVQYLLDHKVHLTITRERKSVLGDYRNRFADKNHRISVNGNLNPYSFLITLLHELAHLFTYEKFGHRVAAHGEEWKREFGILLAAFIKKQIFPADITKALLHSVHNPAASSCADVQLTKVLRQYDPHKKGQVFIEELPNGACFKIEDGRVFRKESLLRKRYRCIEIKTGLTYLFSPVFEVIPIQQNS
ncbi:MAG: hypothetical protein RLY16_435 [Bacteroidota bacterium]|jgi:hypothetical protein